MYASDFIKFYNVLTTTSNDANEEIKKKMDARYFEITY